MRASEFGIFAHWFASLNAITQARYFGMFVHHPLTCKVAGNLALRRVDSIDSSQRQVFRQDYIKKTVFVMSRSRLSEKQEKYSKLLFSISFRFSSLIVHQSHD